MNTSYRPFITTGRSVKCPCHVGVTTNLRKIIGEKSIVYWTSLATYSPDMSIYISLCNMVTNMKMIIQPIPIFTVSWFLGFNSTDIFLLIYVPTTRITSEAIAKYSTEKLSPKLKEDSLPNVSDTTKIHWASQSLWTTISFKAFYSLPPLVKFPEDNNLYRM